MQTRRLDKDAVWEPAQQVHRRSSAAHLDRTPRHSKWHRANLLDGPKDKSQVYQAFSTSKMTDTLKANARQNLSVYQSFAKMAVSSVSDTQLDIYSAFCRDSLL